MGTGIVGILLHQLPWNTAVIRGISIGFFVLNLMLFLAFFVITVLRYSLYPETWSVMIHHETQSLFLGCFPMALASMFLVRSVSMARILTTSIALINMFALVCSQWGSWVAYMAWALWWLDAALSVACCVSVPLVVLVFPTVERPLTPSRTHC